MQFYLAQAGLANGIIAVVLGIFILAKNFKEKNSRYFFLLSILTAFSGLAFWQWLSVESINNALPWIKIFTIALIFQPIVYLRIISSLLNLKTKRAQLIFFLASIYYALLVIIDLFIGKLGPVMDFTVWPGYKFTFIIYVATHAIGLTAYLFYLLVESYYSELKISKLQTRYLFAATLFAFISWYSHILLWFGIEVQPFGSLFSCFYLVVVAYLLAKERLMDMRLILSKVYVYTILLFLIFLFYSVFYYLDANIDPSSNWGSVLVRLTFALIFLLFFLPFAGIVRKSADLIFFKGYNPGSVIKDVLIRFTSVIELDELLDVLAEEFNRAIGTDKVGFLIFNVNENDEIEGFKFNPSINLSFIFHPSERLLAKIKANKKIIIRNELGPEDSEIAEELKFHGINNISPLIFKDKIIGLMIINDKLNGESFTQEEIEFIEVIGRQASVAIINAMLHKQVEDLNDKLQLKYKKQTTALKEHSEDLQEFFIISSLKVKEQLLAVKDILKSLIGKSKANKQTLSEPYLKVLKTADIINDIIEVSEMDSSDFSADITDVDLKKVLKKVYTDRSTAAKLKKLKFSLKLPNKKIPPIKSNSKYLEQAIVNLVNNAIRYTEKGSVALSLEYDGTAATVRVSDTGIGIAKKDIPNLFSRFQRGSNAENAHPDGSGLGLYIVKNIIDAHNGASVYVENTTINKGTTIALKFKL